MRRENERVSIDDEKQERSEEKICNNCIFTGRIDQSSNIFLYFLSLTKLVLNLFNDFASDHFR